MDTSARSQETSPAPAPGLSLLLMVSVSWLVTHDTGTMSPEDHIINANYNMAWVTDKQTD